MDKHSQNTVHTLRTGAAQSTLVRICLLGALRIITPNSTGHEAVGQRFQTQKTAALLAYLALQPTRSHGREFLVDLFWPDSDEENGRRSLRVALTSLRRQLEPPGVPNNMVLIANRNTVRLNFPDGVSTDVADFESLLATAPGEEETLDEALVLYEGPLLPGFYDDWALRERERLVDLYRGLLLRRSRLAEEKEGFAVALDYAHRAANLEEDREAAGNEMVCEDAHIAVIRLLTQAGRHDDARRQYGTLTRRLNELYDEAPSPQARALLESVTLPITDAAPPAKAATHSIITKPARTKASTSPRLPLVLSRFFGRGTETDQLNSALFVSGSRLVTLTGPGGSGKTRFAIEFARRCSASSAVSAVYFTALADLESGGQIWIAVADAMGIERSHDTATLRSGIVQKLHELPGGPCLLILDNFETLVETGAPLLTSLLADVPDLRIVVTSRRRLGLSGEQEIPITPLPVPTLPGTPDRLMEWSSVQLFVDRAQASRSDFQMTPRSSETIATLCCRLDGIPLALELTAAWAGVLSPSQMLDRVEKLVLDEAGPPLAYHRARRAERHRTLRAAIDGSFSLLSPELREAFARLSVFRGGWTLAAAEHLLDDMPSPAPDLLSRLRERSLVVVETGQDGESLRFRMLDTLREFAAEQLNDEKKQDLHHRCAVYFTDYETAACRSEKENQAAALARIDTDYPNYKATIDWLAGKTDASEEALIHGMRLSGAIGWYWLLRGYTKSGCDLYRRFLSVSPPNSASEENTLSYLNARLSVLISAAQLVLRTDTDVEKNEAEKWAAEALDLALQGYGSGSERVEAHNVLGMCAMARADYAAARTHYEAALDFQKESKTDRIAGAPLTNLGLVCWYQGDFVSAERYFTDSLAEDRATADRQGEARSLLNLGLVACVRGDLSRSQSLLETSLFIRREMKDQHGLVNVLGNLGEILLKQNKDTEAKEALSESLTIARRLGDSQQIAYALGILGSIATRQGQFQTASEHLTESVSLLVARGDRFHIQNALEAYASLAYAAAAHRYKANAILAEKAKIAFERAVAFWAAADTLREEIGNFLLDEDKIIRDEQMTFTRAALGPRNFEARQASGRKLTLEDLVAETRKPL